MSSTGGAGPLVPTFHGFVHNSMDGLVLFEACLSGKLHHVPRRPHDRERGSLIKSGSIFIYEENASGIKRWTDGVAWSPSRILGNFLIYRELEKPFPPGEKKRAMKRKRASLPGEPYPRRDSDENESQDPTAPLTPPTPTVNNDVKLDGPASEQDKELERSLIGSLADSYGFRPDGLVKKTMSISMHGISHHMVSYYKVDDVKNSLLPRPLSDPRLQSISVRPDLYLKQNFRAPVEETEHYAIDGQMHAHPQMIYSPMAAGGYGVRPGQYFGQQYPVYGMGATTGANLYGGMTGTAWPTQQPSAAPLSYASQAGYTSQSYNASYYRPATEQSNQQVAKQEPQSAASQSSAYGNQYGTTYSGRSGSSASSQIIHQQQQQQQHSYPTPVQHSTSTFGSISAHGSRPSYSSSSILSGTPNTPQPQQQMYSSTPTQQYPVRSPPYHHMPSAAGHSQSSSVKSPVSAPSYSSISSQQQPSHAQDVHPAQMPYRGGSYVQQPTHEMQGLGINGGAHYSQSAAHSYAQYGASGQDFKHVGEVGTSHGGQRYTQ